MQLPGRLKTTTLGDVLGSLHRAEVSGTLELIEGSGRTHRVHLSGGLVTAVEVERASASLGDLLQREHALDDDTLRRSLLRALASGRLHGEVLVRDFQLSPEILDRALRRQLLLRLRLLEELTDAQVLYRVALRPPRGALLEAPLSAADFLVGRRRARDRSPESSAHRAAPRARMPARDPAPATTDALRVLGVSSRAPVDEVKRAYRRLVRELHPDLHPGASQAEQSALSARLSEVTAAYRSLVA